MTKPYKRRILVINKPFQIRFCLYAVSWIFGLSLFYPFIVYYTFDFLLRYMSLDPAGPQLTDIQEARGKLIIFLILAQLVIIAVSLVMNLLLSHRIAGPLFKLRQTFERVRAGEKVEPIAFRKYDHFQELAESFNGMMRALGHAPAPAGESALAHLERELQTESDPSRRERLARAVSALKDVS